MDTIIKTIREELKKNTTDEKRQGAERFFKETVKFYGCTNGEVHKIAKVFFTEMKLKLKDEIFRLCELLWQSGYMEEAIIACDWSYFIRKQYSENDIRIFEYWIENYVTNWAACDTLCNHTVGEFIEQFPQYIGNLKKWALSKNRWMKRAAAVSLIIPARRGKFLEDIFAIAKLVLTDSDDMVQKGYGWMLKSASEAHQREVFEFVMEYKAQMPRTALRYTIEKMPEKFKKMAMAK